MGFTAAVAQIVLLRELMVVFYGNEISIGLMLASWLAWTAVGSSLAGTLTARRLRPRRVVAAIQVLVAGAAPVTVLAVRAAKGLLQTVPGEVLGPGPMLFTSLAILGPLCLLSGALFTAGSQACATSKSASAEGASGSVYLWEAVGSSAGGLVAGVLLVRLWGSCEIACFLSLCNLASACGLTISMRALRYAAIGLLAGVATLAAVLRAPGYIDRISQERFWRGQQLIATRNSVYGSLAVTGTEASRTVYENGVVLFTSPDAAAAEEAVHYALLEHPSPQRLLLIGGGINGSIAQALRHPSLRQVDYVELDPAILDLAREHFPGEWQTIQADPRVRVHVTDGRLFVKTTPCSFDVVIVNLPDPQNAQLNRFYTAEFFREVSRKLTSDGVLSLQLRSSEDYISPELAEFLRTVQQSLRTVFAEVRMIPGETVHFFAAQQAGILADGASELLARLRQRNLATRYVSEYFIPFRMMPDRTLDLETKIRTALAAPINRDFTPAAYYFDVALWSTQFNQNYRRFFRVLSGIPFEAALAAPGIALAVAVVAGRKQRRLQIAAGSCTASAGFTMIGLEMLLLLGFQSVYGYVYQQLALVIAGFMAGLAAGSWLATGRGSLRRTRQLAITQVLVAAAPLLLVALLQGAAQAGSTPALAACRAAFLVASVLSGMLGGFEFRSASAVFFQGAERLEGRRLGTLYALDLAGSCVGAVLFSTWFIPIFGFLKTALLMSLISMAPAVLASLASEADSAAAAIPPASALQRPAP